MNQVSKKVIEKLTKDDQLVFAIARDTGRRFETVRKWAFEKNGGNKMLKTKAVVTIISKETGLSENDILEPATATA